MDHYQSTQINYCPNCGKPVEPDSIYCGECGAQLDYFSDLNYTIESDRPTYENQTLSDRNTPTESIELRKRGIASKWIILIPLIAITFFLFIFFLTQNSSRSNKTTVLPNPMQQADNQFFVTLSPDNLFPTSPPEKSLSTIPTEKPIHTVSSQKLSPTFIPTEFKCPGMPPSRVKVGDKVIICSIERLILREDPNMSGTIVRYFNPGTKGEIIGGPECADQSTWWKVRINYNNRLYEGWMKEGTDPKAKYFLCVDDENQ